MESGLDNINTSPENLLSQKERTVFQPSVFRCSLKSLNHNGWVEKSTLNLTPNLTPCLIRIPQKTLNFEGSKVALDHYEPSSSTKYTPSTSKIAMENPPCVFICWYISYCKRRTSISTLDVTCDVFFCWNSQGSKISVVGKFCLKLCVYLFLAGRKWCISSWIATNSWITHWNLPALVNLRVFCCSPSWD